MTGPITKDAATMLSLLDDFAVHQSPAPIREPASGHANAYDRYFANGFSKCGDFYFALGLGRYPNRDIMDAAFTVQFNGFHHSFFVSMPDPLEPTQMILGPLQLRIEAPMRRMRIVLAKNESGISCDLLWHARSAPIEEERTVRTDGVTVKDDIKRWTQFGCWEGWFQIDDTRVPVRIGDCLGVKDRSWGVRSLGLSEDEDAEADFRGPELTFWNWIPLNFASFFIHSLRFEDAAGTPHIMEAMTAPLYPAEDDVPINEPAVRNFAGWDHDYAVSVETRGIVGGTLSLHGQEGRTEDATIAIGAPVLVAYPYAIGYNHETWCHGADHCGFATGHQRWDVSQVDNKDPRFALKHQIVPVRCGDAEGFGFVEQFSIGPQAKYGFPGQDVIS